MRKLPHHLAEHPNHYPKETTMTTLPASVTQDNSDGLVSLYHFDGCKLFPSNTPPSTLYMVEMTGYPAESLEACYRDEEGNDVYCAKQDWKPEGWDEHCIATWGVLRSFFWPSVSKVYRSRSSARAKLEIIERWGGTGRIIVGTAKFLPEEDLKRAKAFERQQARINKLKAQIAAIQADPLG